MATCSPAELVLAATRELRMSSSSSGLFIFAKLKLKKIVDIGVTMSIYEIITIVPPSHHYYPKDVPGGEKPWLQSKADLKKW